MQWKSAIIIAQLVASYYYYNNYGSLELMHAVCLLCVHGFVCVCVSGMGMHACRNNVVHCTTFVVHVHDTTCTTIP